MEGCVFTTFLQNHHGNVESLWEESTIIYSTGVTSLVYYHWFLNTQLSCCDSDSPTATAIASCGTCHSQVLEEVSPARPKWWLIAIHCLYLQRYSPSAAPLSLLKASNLRRQCQPASQPASALIYWQSWATALLSRSPELHVVAVYWCGRTITGFRITLDQQNASAPDWM